MSSEPQRGERSSFSSTTILGAFAVSLAVGFVAAIYIYEHFVTYTPRAVLRVPDSPELVVRLNVEQAVVYAPLKKFILPLFERGRQGPEPRKLHLERKTTVELDVDVRELVYARWSDKRWLLIAAGLLRSEDVLAGVSRMLEDEAIPHEVRGELLLHPSGRTFAVAEDGMLLLGSGESVVREALGAAQKEPSWAAPLQGKGVALGIYGGPEEFGDSNKRAGTPRLLGGVFVVQADSHFPTSAQLRLAEGDWTSASVSALLQENAKNFRYLVPLASLRARADSTPPIRARGNLSREQFDASVKRFAAVLERELFGALPKPSSP